MRSHRLAPLTILTYIKKKFKWAQVTQYASEKINGIVAHYNLSTYTDYNEIFKKHTDASVFQLVAVIIQKGKHIAFYNLNLLMSNNSKH